jgi:hypothetical protein
MVGPGNDLAPEDQSDSGLPARYVLPAQQEQVHQEMSHVFDPLWPIESGLQYFNSRQHPAALDKLDADPELRRHVLDKFDRDEEYYAKTGDPMRHDLQNARKIYAQQGLRGLFRALDSGKVALPGLAGAGLLGLGFEGHRDSGSNHDSN